MPWDALSNPYGNGFKVGTKVKVICPEGAGQGKPLQGSHTTAQLKAFTSVAPLEDGERHHSKSTRLNPVVAVSLTAADLVPDSPCCVGDGTQCMLQPDTAA